jgi:iron complex outermembrane recepter protein
MSQRSVASEALPGAVSSGDGQPPAGRRSGLLPVTVGIALFLALAVLLAPGPTPLGAQDGVVLEGRVADEATGLPLRGVRIFLVDLRRDVLTDGAGSFRIPSVPPGTHRIRVEALGYRTEARDVTVAAGAAPVRVALTREALPLPEVVATGTPLRGVAPYQPGQAFGAEELQARSADSFGQMLDGEPGLAMHSLGVATGRPVIRGLDGDRVAVLENGQRMGDMSETAHDHAIALEPLTAERVEVVRGPASLLYGSSALGGVVNLLRRDIPTEWTRGLSGSSALQFASVNRLRAGAGAAEYGGGSWAGRARASFRDGNDFRAPGAPEGVLGSTHTRLNTGGLGVGFEGDGVRGGAALDLHGHVFGIPEELDDDDHRIEIRSRRMRLSALLNLSRPGDFFRDLEFRTVLAGYDQREVEIETTPDGSFEEAVPHDFRRLTADAGVTAVHGAVGPVGQGAVGFSALVSELRARGFEEFHPDGQSLSVAAFLFEQIPLHDRVDLLLGLRFEHGRTRAFENEVFPGFSDRRTATTISGAIGFGARLGPGIEVGGQLARAHRAPLLEQLFADGPHIGAGRFEVGESTLANEVGHGVDLFARLGGDRVRAELALFGNRIADFVFPRNTGDVHPESGLPVVRWTASSAQFTGGEVVVEVLATRDLRLRAIGDLVRGVERNETRTPLPFIPPARGSLEARYDPGAWWLGARARRAAQQSRVPPTQEPTDGYTLVDVQAGLRLGGRDGHTLVVRVDNALDEVYRDHLSRVDERRFPMPGRNVTVVYRLTF